MPSTPAPKAICTSLPHRALGAGRGQLKGQKGSANAKRLTDKEIWGRAGFGTSPHAPPPPLSPVPTPHPPAEGRCQWGKPGEGGR